MPIGMGWCCLEAAREAGLIEALGRRAMLAIAKFVTLIDKLGVVAAAPVEEVLGHVLSESGYQQFLRESDEEEDEERLANIEELLTAAREFDEQHPGQGHLEEWLEEASLVNDTDAWAEADDRVTHDDAARVERAGISGGVHRGVGRGAVAARAQPREPRSTGRGAPAAVRGHDPGRRRVGPEHGPLSRISRSCGD